MRTVGWIPWRIVYGGQRCVSAPGRTARGRGHSVVAMSRSCQKIRRVSLDPSTRNVEPSHRHTAWTCVWFTPSGALPRKKFRRSKPAR
jgi:hypothetical protein